MRLEYDRTKNRSNQEKHGIPLSSARRLEWSAARIWLDARNNYGEQRWCALAFLEGRLHHVTFAMRGTTRRIISLCKANRRERRMHEQR
ncbi:MAG: BrnT family toxin [Gemmatimonadetes bacterium]|nr:BrnT family toxin [Gemmatimonadota bacterium]